MTWAERYGLPWGIVMGLATAIVYLYRTTVKQALYDAQCARNEALAQSVTDLVTDVRTLLALTQRGGWS